MRFEYHKPTMRRIWFALLLSLGLAVNSWAQQNRLKFFEGEWEGTVKDFDSKGKQTQRFKARRVLKFVSSDTLRGTYQILGENIESQPVRIEIIEVKDGFVFKQAGRAYAGTYKDKTFTFQGEDENEVEMRQSHYFIGGDMEFFKVEQIDSGTKIKFARLQGVFKLKKD